MTRQRVNVSEITTKTLKLAFKTPLSNTTRLQVCKAYGFPDVEDTKFTKLDRGH